MLEHGGRLLQAAKTYGIAPEAWLDLSTGISPFGWPVPSIPSSVWQRLPEDDDGLVEAACAYYGAMHLLPVAGSQAAIQALPLLRPPSRVGVIAPGYNGQVVRLNGGVDLGRTGDDFEAVDVVGIEPGAVLHARRS